MKPKFFLLPAALLLLTACPQISAQCGVVGAMPGVAIQIFGVAEGSPPGVEIWRDSTFNVQGSSTSAGENPHVKYLDAFRTIEAYSFKTTSSFPNFVSEQGYQILTRNVTFMCSTGESVVQNFEIMIDFVEPTLPCGVLGARAGVAIQISGIAEGTPTGVEIWRDSTFNVQGSSTSAVENPHVKYLDAFRTIEAYSFKTTSSFPNFVSEQGYQILTRNVTFMCSTGERVVQNFEVILDFKI